MNAAELAARTEEAARLNATCERIVREYQARGPEVKAHLLLLQVASIVEKLGYAEGLDVAMRAIHAKGKEIA